MGYRGRRNKRGGKFPKNKKVKNATPNVYDGVKFRSKLEAFTYKLLKERGIRAEYEAHKYVLIPPFVYDNLKIRACTYTPDFVGNGWILEVKGYATESFIIKWKLFKYVLNSDSIKKKLFLVNNQKEVREAIDLILSIK